MVVKGCCNLDFATIFGICFEVEARREIRRGPSGLTINRDHSHLSRALERGAVRLVQPRSVRSQICLRPLKEKKASIFNPGSLTSFILSLSPPLSSIYCSQKRSLSCDWVCNVSLIPHWISCLGLRLWFVGLVQKQGVQDV